MYFISAHWFKIVLWIEIRSILLNYHPVINNNIIIMSIFAPQKINYL